MSSPHSAGREVVYSHIWEEAGIIGAILEAGFQCSLKSNEQEEKSDQRVSHKKQDDLILFLSMERNI